MTLKDKLLRQIQNLKLDLKNKIVLTEAATGAYVVTPILAAMAGAEVYAYTRTTRYGSYEDVVAATKEVMKGMNMDLNIHFINKTEPEIIAKADIITNSGHLRPLNKEKLQYARKGTVIPLMYEAWEWREPDLDIEYCRQKGIIVGATNERHPDVDVFSYLGDMALKMIFDAGLTPYKNKFVLVCNNDFGPYIAKTLTKICDGLGVIDLPQNRSKYRDSITFLSDFPKINVPEEFRNAEGIIFTAYPFDKEWIGQEKQISVEEIKKQFSNPFILRYAGDIDTNGLNEVGIKYYPLNVDSGHMGILPSEIGYDPIIRLQAGGLKVGEALLSGNEYYNDQRIFEYV